MSEEMPIEEKEVMQKPTLSYEFERKPRVVESVGYRQFAQSPRINALDVVPLASPTYVHTRVMPEEIEEEPAASKLQKIRNSVQGVQRFSGRLGAAFAKRAPQVGVLNHSKRNLSNSRPGVGSPRTSAMKSKRKSSFRL